MVSDSIRARPMIMVTVIFPEASGFLAIPEQAPPMPEPMPRPQPSAGIPTARAAAIQTRAILTLPPAAAAPPSAANATADRARTRMLVKILTFFISFFLLKELLFGPSSNKRIENSNKFQINGRAPWLPKSRVWKAGRIPVPAPGIRRRREKESAAEQRKHRQVERECQAGFPWP